MLDLIFDVGFAMDRVVMYHGTFIALPHRAPRVDVRVSSFLLPPSRLNTTISFGIET